MLKKQLLLLIFVSIFFGWSVQRSCAAVIDSADVNGYTTFQDTNTGLVWLDLDNFYDSTSTYGTTGYDMISAATTAGFTFATKSKVEGLLGGLSLASGEWSSYASIMGYGIPRNLIWGMYDDLNGNPYGWAYSYSTDSSWGYADDSTDASSIQNLGFSGQVDMGIWAYQTSSPVPEPATFILLGSGLAGLAFYRRKRK